MAPKRTTRSTPATTTTITTTMTNAQLKVMIDQGVTAALVARDADRIINGNDSHNSGTGVTERVIEFDTVTVGTSCLYSDLDKPKKKITDKYYPKGEIKKLKVEMWNLKVKGTDVCNGTTQRPCRNCNGFATELIDKKIRTFAERQSETKESKMITNNNNKQKAEH
ncbi:hypothetical protein Tco_0868678 [Tanacetum coccineum]